MKTIFDIKDEPKRHHNMFRILQMIEILQTGHYKAYAYMRPPIGSIVTNAPIKVIKRLQKFYPFIYNIKEIKEVKWNQKNRL